MKKYQFLILILVILFSFTFNICAKDAPMHVLVATSGSASSDMECNK